MKHPLRLALPLTLALVILTVVILGGREEDRLWPSISNYRGSGLAAFATLLEREGYRVVLERSPNPKLGKGDVPVMVNPTSFNFFEESPVEEEGEEESPPPNQPDPQGSIGRHVEAGGTLVALQVISPLPQPKDEAVKPKTFARSGSSQGFSAAANGEDNPPGPALYRGDGLFSSVVQRKKGRIIVVHGGVAATNRFLPLADNASLLLDHVRRAAAPGSRLIFAEASFGNGTEDTLVGMLGSWAVAARYQFALLLAVAAWSLSRRFGREVRERPKQRSARDMIDAFGQALRVGRRNQLALRVLASQAEARIKKALKVPASVDFRTVLARIPPSAYTAYSEAMNMAASPNRLSRKDVLKAASTLDSEVSKIEQDRRTVR